jgi:hypothetical protein
MGMAICLIPPPFTSLSPFACHAVVLQCCNVSFSVTVLALTWTATAAVGFVLATLLAVRAIVWQNKADRKVYIWGM